MNKISKPKTPEQMVEAIFKLDLDPIKLKLMEKQEGQGWTRAEADRYELEYRRFLALLAKFPDQVIAPNRNVDKFWHGHILDTMKYAEDCEHVFGYFLHHFPYFGMRDEEDAANLAQAARNMQRLYQREFGEAGAQDAAYCGVAADKSETAYCGRVDTAYCGRVAGQAEKLEQESAYCGVAAASYCGVVAGKGRPSLEESTAYCGRAAKPEQESAYCGRVNVAADVAYCGVVAGKGRPKLDQLAEAGAA